MTFFDKYIQAQNHADVDALVSLFTEDAVFRDFGGRTVGQRKELYAEGAEAMRKLFTKIFASPARPELSIIKQEAFSMEYQVKMGPAVMICVGCADIGEDGLVKEYIVRPR